MLIPTAPLVPPDEVYSAKQVIYAARLGMELGVDIVKTFYTGSAETFAQVVEAAAPAVVVAAGGPRLETDEDVLDMVRGRHSGRSRWHHLRTQYLAERRPARPDPNSGRCSPFGIVLMPLINSSAILADARSRGYGIPSLLAGDLEMIVGQIRAAEALRSPLILAFNQGVTPGIPLEIGLAAAADAASKASVPVSVILDHGESIEQIVSAIRNGTSSIMFDGSALPYEENVHQTRRIVSIAHAVGVDVEAELGAIAGSSINLGEAGPDEMMTDPKQAVDFVTRTGVDVLAISFGNAHGIYTDKPQLDLDRVRTIHNRIDIPLAMHGASGLEDGAYSGIIAAGISKICYYTAMARQASRSIKTFTADAAENDLIYHNIIDHSTDFFEASARQLMTLLGCAGKA